MAYLLLLPIGIYVAFATVVLRRQPHSTANVALALYIVSVAAATAGLVVLGTTSSRATADAAAVLAVVVSSWSYLVFMPLVLIGLYFENWLQLYRRLLLVIIPAMMIMLGALLLVHRAYADLPFALQVGPHAWVDWTFSHGVVVWPRNVGAIFASQAISLAIIGVAVHQRRLRFWPGAVPLTLLFVFSMMIPSLAPLVTVDWLVIIAALKFAPPMIWLSVLIMRSSHMTTLDRLVKTTLRMRRDGMIVLDAGEHVVWHNSQAERWISGSLTGAMAPLHILELLRGSPLLKTVREMLANRATAAECLVALDDDEHVLELELEPLGNLSQFPKAKLLIMRDVTAARIRRDLDVRRSELLALSAISADISSSLDVEQAITRALQQVRTIIQADGVTVYLANDETPDTLYCAGQLVVSDSMPPVPDTLPKQGTTAGEVILARKPIISLEDAKQSARNPRLSRAGIMAGATVPLITRNEVIGVLQVGMQREHTFDPIEVALLESVGRQLAVAIDNGRLHTRERDQRHRAEVLREVANVLATKPLDSALNLVLGLLRALLEFDRATFLLMAEPGFLRLAAWSGFEDLPNEQLLRERRIEIAQFPYLDRLFRDRATQIVADTRADPAWKSGDFGYHSWMGVPLLSQNRILGCLSISDLTSRQFSNADLEIARTFADQVAVAVENATLFQEATRRVTLSTDLGRLSLAMSAQLEQAEVLKLICSESLAVFNVQGAYIWLLRQGQMVGSAAHGPGAGEFIGQTLDRVNHTLLPVRSMNEWRPHYTNCIEENPTLPAEFVRITGARSAIAVPLLKAEVPVGVLVLVSTQNDHAFGDWLTEQIGLFGVQATLALQNAGLFDEVRRRFDQVRLVNEVGRFATAILSPSELVDGVARKLYEILAYDTVAMLNVTDGEPMVQAVFVHGQTFAIEKALDYYLAPDGVAIEAIRHSEPQIRNQVCRLLPDSSGQGAFFDCCSLAVPLIIADEVIGVLMIEREGFNSVGQEDLDVLEPLAAQLAISVSNAGLFEQVRLQAIELEARVAQRTAEIREQQERTEAILRSVADAVIVFDLNGRVVLTNPSARRLFDRHDLDMDLGTRVGLLVARSVSDHGKGDGSTEIIELGDTALQAKAARVVEDGGVSGSVVVLRDISQLQELDRMRDRFVSNVSHELRTPLANLKLYLSLLQQGRPERRQSYLEVMGREVDRLARLIEDLLQISRLQSQRRAERPHLRAPVRFETLIDAVIQQNSAWAENEHKTLVYAPGPLPLSHGDPDQLVRILTNLVSNAISYTPEGGQITVRSQAVSNKQTGAESVIIEVSDTGIGIPAYEQPRIFERFFRGSNVSPTIPGTGLGLAIIKDIVELHQGKIEVESQEGQGSTFRLILPVLTE